MLKPDPFSTLVFRWSVANTWHEKISLDFVRWGLVTFTTLSLQGLLSIRSIRRVAYRFFYVTHVMGSVIFLVAVSVWFSYFYITVLIAPAVVQTCSRFSSLCSDSRCFVWC